MKLLKYTACLALAALSLSANVAHAFGLGIRPSNLEVVYSAGGTYRQQIEVQNVSTTNTIKLVVSSADWDLDDKNSFSLQPPASSNESAADWIRFSPSTLLLKPTESATVTVDIAVPVKLESLKERRVAILVSTLLPSEQERLKHRGVWNRWQVSSLFYLTPANKDVKSDKIVPVAPSVAISPSTPRFVGDKLVIPTDINNSAPHHLRLEGTIDITNSAGSVVHKSTFTNVILANREVKGLDISTDWPESLPQGDYNIVMKASNIFSPTYPKNHMEPIFSTTVPLSSSAWFSKKSSRPTTPNTATTPTNAKPMIIPTDASKDGKATPVEINNTPKVEKK